MDPISVLIVDDQPLIRSGLRAGFADARDIVVVGEASSGEDAVRVVQQQRPDVVLMDIVMPGMNGVEATRRICRPGTTKPSVVILTMYDCDEYVFEALRAGACGFVLKDVQPEVLTEAVRQVAAGRGILSPSVTRRLISEFARRRAPTSDGELGLSRLTRREREVFQLLAQGHRTEEVASVLRLCESTVKSHVQHLYHKLGVRDRVQVVIYAYENGLI